MRIQNRHLIVLLFFITLLKIRICDGEELRSIPRFSGTSGLYFSKLENTYVYDTNYILIFRLNKPLATHLVPLPNGVVIRQKRGLDHGLLPFVGWINQKLTGVATTRDLDDLRVQSSGLTDYVRGLKNLTIQNSLGLKEIISDMTHLKTYDYQMFSALYSSLVNLKIFNQQTVKFENSLRDDIQKLYLHMKNITNYLEIKREFDYYYLGYELGLSTCRSERIPENLIPKSMLRSNLTSIEKLLLTTPYQLSIPISELDWYYIFEIVFCHEYSNGLTLMISIPLIRKTLSEARIEKLTPIPVRLNNQTFILSEAKPSLLISNGNSLSILRSIDKNCLSENELDLSNCLIHVSQSESIDSQSCIYKIHSGASIREYKESCLLSEIKAQKISWVQLNSTHWVYTGPERQLIINCYGRNQQTIMQIGGTHHSSILSVPCNCWTSDGLLSSSSTLSSCQMVPSITHLHLYVYHYIPYDDLKISSYRLESSFEFSSKIESLKSPLNLHNYSEELKLLDHYMGRVNRKVPEISWESPYHSIWEIVAGSIALTLVVLISCCLFKNCKSVLLGGGIVHQFKPVRASALPDWVEITYDFFIFIVILSGVIMTYVMVKRILYRLSCHHLTVIGMERVIGPHCDLILTSGGNGLSIALKRIPNLPHLYRTDITEGLVHATHGVLHLNGFSPLEDISGGKIPIDGSYAIDSKLTIESCSGIIQVHKLYQ